MCIRDSTEYDTNYDLLAGYNYVFLSYPEFTSQYTDYFKTTVLKAVSYTHLDVYKRQVLEKGCANGLSFFILITV